MRQLTQTEIEKAPEWATHYGICEDNDVLFENEEFFTFASKPKKKLGQLFGVDEDSKPIPRKEFDITNYEFCDESVTCDGCGIYDIVNLKYEIDTSDPIIYIEKKDAIALAKHFKLTADDLR